jgi:hypothetical protein
MPVWLKPRPIIKDASRPDRNDQGIIIVDVVGPFTNDYKVLLLERRNRSSYSVPPACKGIPTARFVAKKRRCPSQDELYDEDD